MTLTLLGHTAVSVFLLCRNIPLNIYLCYRWCVITYGFSTDCEYCVYLALLIQINITAHDYPFEDYRICLSLADYHYQVTIDTAHPKNAEDWVQGHLTLWLYGDNGNVIEKVQITK